MIELVVCILLPMGLVTSGVILGVFCGASAIWTNLSIMESNRPAGTRYMLVALCSAGSIAIWFVGTALLVNVLRAS